MAAGSLGQNLMATCVPGDADWHRCPKVSQERLHTKDCGPVVPSLRSLYQELAAQILQHTKSDQASEAECQK